MRVASGWRMLGGNWPRLASGLIFVGLATPRDPNKLAVREAQARQLLEQVPSSALLSILVSACLAAALADSVAAIDLLTLVGLVTAFNLGRRRWATSLLRDEPALRATAVHPHRILLMSLCAAILSTLPGLLWFDSVGTAGQFIICVLMAGMMSGGSVSLSGLPSAAMLYVTILGAGLIDNYLSLGVSDLAAISILFALSLIATTLAGARRLVASHQVELALAEKCQLVELLRAFDASGSSWVWEIDHRFRVKAMSGDMAQIFGLDGRSIIGRSALKLLDPSGHGLGMSTGFRTLRQQVRTRTEFRDLALPVLDGSRWWSLSGQPIVDHRGRLTGWRGVGSDISDVRLTGSDSIAIARRDPLTKLANRLLIRELVEEALMRNAAGGPAFAFLLIDLDRFKQVNDTLGHAIGDQLLVQVATRLQLATDGAGQVGRLGGDEFAVLIAGGIETRHMSSFCRDLIETLSTPYRVGEADLVIGASIGVAVGPVDGSDDQALIRSADLALYRAKESGRGQHSFYEPAMLAEAQENRLLESDVRTALIDRRMSLAYQPIIDARTREIVGREALLRWNHPQRGAISPDRFIPIIEDLGLIGQIGSWVIHQACADAVCWPTQERVAVNISVAQLRGASLAVTVVAALGATGLAPDRLELEVTESIFLGDDAGTLRSLESLRALGVRLVLDDFGKGYSSFGYLSRVSFAKIKIDRLFVHDAAEGCRRSRAIIESIMALARGLDIQTTAEGVETAAEAEVMSALGCSQLQGYYFGRPAPFDQNPVPRPSIGGGRDQHDRRIVRFG